MQYYILLPGDTEQDAMLETNLLGEASFKTFYSGRGLTALMKMIDRAPEMLATVFTIPLLVIAFRVSPVLGIAFLPYQLWLAVATSLAFGYYYN